MWTTCTSKRWTCFNRHKQILIIVSKSFKFLLCFFWKQPHCQASELDISSRGQPLLAQGARLTSWGTTWKLIWMNALSIRCEHHRIIAAERWGEVYVAALALCSGEGFSCSLTVENALNRWGKSDLDDDKLTVIFGVYTSINTLFVLIKSCIMISKK